MPASNFKNYQGRINTTFKPSDKFSAGASLNVVNSGGSRSNAGRYIEELTYWSPRHDINDYLEDNGTMRTYGTTTNPRYVAETNLFKDDVLRMLGNVNFSYQPLKWLNFSYRLGLDAYRDNRRNTAPGFQDLVGEMLVDDNGSDQFPGYGMINVYSNKFRTINSTFIVSADHKFSDDFSGTLRLGHELYDRSITQDGTAGSNLTIYNWYELQNAKFLEASTYLEKYRLMGIFGELSLNYKDLFSELYIAR